MRILINFHHPELKEALEKEGFALNIVTAPQQIIEVLVSSHHDACLLSQKTDPEIVNRILQIIPPLPTIILDPQSLNSFGMINPPEEKDHLKIKFVHLVEILLGFIKETNNRVECYQMGGEEIG